jgi:hypothetical protein
MDYLGKGNIVTNRDVNKNTTNNNNNEKNERRILFYFILAHETRDQHFTCLYFCPA